jgi:hypothetical protein
VPTAKLDTVWLAVAAEPVTAQSVLLRQRWLNGDSR